MRKRGRSATATGAMGTESSARAELAGRRSAPGDRRDAATADVAPAPAPATRPRPPARPASSVAASGVAPPRFAPPGVVPPGVAAPGVAPPGVAPPGVAAAHDAAAAPCSRVACRTPSAPRAWERHLDGSALRHAVAELFGRTTARCGRSTVFIRGARPIVKRGAASAACRPTRRAAGVHAAAGDGFPPQFSRSSRGSP